MPNSVCPNCVRRVELEWTKGSADRLVCPKCGFKKSHYGEKNWTWLSEAEEKWLFAQGLRKA